MILSNIDIKSIFSAILCGIGQHESFSTMLSLVVTKADPDNFRILKPALLEIIEKYNLTEERYLTNAKDNIPIYKSRTIAEITNNKIPIVLVLIYLKKLILFKIKRSDR